MHSLCIIYQVLTEKMRVSKQLKQWCNLAPPLITINRNKEVVDVTSDKIHCSNTRISFSDESMDLDPNYDPSDFLKMSSTSKDSSQPRVTYESESVSVDYSINVNIKQEPTSHQQQSPYDQSAFNMSEMLMYKEEPEQGNSRSEMKISGEPSGAQSQSSIVQQENIAAIHDDLAISDSDEDEQGANEGQKKVHSDNDNDDDGDGLWF